MIVIMLKPVSAYLDEIPAKESCHAAGKILFHSQDAVCGLYLVLTGEFHLVRHDAHGRTIILQRARAGAIVAEASLFSPAYHCGAVAVVPSRTKRFAIAAIRRRLGNDPGFSESWAAHLAREVQSARLRAEILSMARVCDRLDGWIAWNDGRMPVRGEGKYVAGEIGVSPEALYRELARRRNGSGNTVV